MKKPKIERILTVGTVAVIFIAWILASTVGGVKELFIPSPKSVLTALIEVTRNGYKGSTLLQHIVPSEDFFF